MVRKIKIGLVGCAIFAIIAMAGCNSKPTHTSDTSPISHTDDMVTVYPNILYEFEVETGTRVKGYGEFRDGLFYITEVNGNKWDGVELDRVYVIQPGDK